MHRPHRQFDREGGEKREPSPSLQAAREAVAQERGDFGRPRVPVHRHDGEQHQHGTEERVEKELEAGVDAARASPHPDDQEHRNEPALEKQIKHHEVERRKGADHERLEHQECDHIFLDAVLDRQPAGDDADRHQRGRQDEERQRDAIDAHVVSDRADEPRPFLDELELGRRGVEAIEQDQRDREGDQRGPQRDPAGVAFLRLVVAAHHHDEQRADERQEYGDGEDRPAHRQPVRAANMNQVMSAATPISMAKA